MKSLKIALAAALAVSFGKAAFAADHLFGLKPGTPEIQSVSALTFGADGILFVGDAQAAKILAIEVRDVQRGPLTIPYIENIDKQIAESLNADAAMVKVHDLTINPMTGHIFIAASAEDAAPKILVIRGGNVALLPLEDIHFSEIHLPNAAEDKLVKQGNRERNNRGSSITDLQYFKGRLLVSGLTADQASSNVWSINFPFDDVTPGTTVEFFHAAHGRTEDYAPIRTFIPLLVNGEPNLIAGFVCTPLVKIPLSELTVDSQERGKVVGTTVAELGHQNQPLDLISYEQDGKDYLLLSNNNRGVMKVSVAGIDNNAGLTEPVRGGGTAGQPFETIEALAGTEQLAKLNDTQAAVLIKNANGGLDFRIIELP